MAYSYEYPYTDPNRSNADWLINRIKELSKEFDEFVLKNQIKYADPIQWNIATQYEQYTIVTNENSAYLSKKAVPSGVSINNADYWLKIADYGELYDSIKHSIAIADDRNSTTSSADRETGALVWLNDKIYEVVREIQIGDAYIIGGVNPNVAEITIEELLKREIALLNASIDAISLEIGERNKDHGLNFATLEGVDRTGVNDVSAILQSALNSLSDYDNTLYIPNGDYRINNGYIYIPKNTKIHGEGVLHCYANTDSFIILGSAINGNETNNVTIEGLTFISHSTSGNTSHIISVYTDIDEEYVPYNISIKNISVKCNAYNDASIFINGAYDVVIDNCYFNGGFRGVGIMAPISKPTKTYKCSVLNSRVENTTAFGLQLYYTSGCSFINNYIDGAKLEAGDKSCITLDRSVNALVLGNTTTRNYFTHIYVAGCTANVISSNIINADNRFGGGTGIYFCTNDEQEEDPSITFGQRNTAIANVFNFITTAIRVKGEHNLTIVDNIVNAPLSNDSILIVDEYDIGVNCESITIIGNIFQTNITNNSNIEVVLIGGFAQGLTGKYFANNANVAGTILNFSNLLRANEFENLANGAGIKMRSANGTSYTFYVQDDGTWAHY